jgi:hypothetical protein
MGYNTYVYGSVTMKLLYKYCKKPKMSDLKNEGQEDKRSAVWRLVTVRWI